MADWTGGFDLPFGDPTLGYNPVDPGGPGGGAPASPPYGGAFGQGGGGGGAGAFGVSGQDNTNAGSFTDPSTWGGTGSGFSLGNIASALGKLPWSTILPLLALAGGGAYGVNRTRTATGQVQQGIQNANNLATSILTGAGPAGGAGSTLSLFAPYRAVGAEGLNRLMNFPQSTLAQRYRPLGTGAGMTLAALSGPPRG